ncbi:MAG: FecR family protein [Planctomycetota bacterium]|nr:FecR family protein [Planctomycetota bacterium]
MGRHLLVFVLSVAVAVAAGAGYYAWKSSRAGASRPATDTVAGGSAGAAGQGPEVSGPSSGGGATDRPGPGTAGPTGEAGGKSDSKKAGRPEPAKGGRAGDGPAAAPVMPEDKDEPPAPVVPDPAGGRPLAKWTEVAGEIGVRRSKDGAVEQAKKTMEMFQADMATLAQGADGEIGFRLSISGRCRLSDGARFVVRGSVNGRDCNQEIELRRGRAHFIVSRTPSGSTFSVKTPLARVHVKAAEFEVSHMPADPAVPTGPWRTEVRCVEGSAVVKPFDKTKKTYCLARGGVAVYDSAGSPRTVPQPAQPKGEF